MKVCFIVNGICKSPKKVYSEIQAFEDLQLAELVTKLETAHSGHAIELAREASETHDIVVAVGGDGTVNEVLNGIVQASKQAILGVFPAGTANDLSRTLNLQLDGKVLGSLIDKKSFRPIDIGHSELVDSEARELERYFINVIDFGIGGYVVEKVANSRKTFGAKFTFLKAIFNSLLTYEQSVVKIEADEFQWEGKLLSLAISNGQYFGSGIQIASDALLDDSKFNACVMSDISTTDYLKHVNKIRKGHKINHKGVRYFTTKELSVRPVDLSCAIDIDGEFCGYAPAKIKLLPKKIQIIAPHELKAGFC